MLDDVSGAVSEARRRALAASAAPDAEMYWTFEQAQALWATIRTRREGSARDPHPNDLTAW